MIRSKPYIMRAALGFFFLCAAPRLVHCSENDAAVLTLAQCYDLALKQNERLQISQQDVEQALLRSRAAIGNVLPTVGFAFTDLFQDSNGNTNSNGSDNYSQDQRKESNLYLKQPLFYGLREFTARSGFIKESEKARYETQRVAMEILDLVAVAYYELLSAEKDAENTRTSIAQARDRLKELFDRRRLGKSRESELLSAEAQILNLEAILQKNEGDIRLRREKLNFLVGRSIGTSRLADEIALSTSGIPFGLDEAVESASKRSDVVALQYKVEAQRLKIRYEKGAYLPTANLVANRYLSRPAYLSGIDWDVLLALDVPLYQGGRVSAKVDEAFSQYKQAQLELQRKDREVRTDIRSAYIQLEISSKQVGLLKDAYEKARVSYSSQVRDYRLGLVDNLEVLNSLSILHQDKILYDRAIYQSKFDWIRLRTAMEDLQ